MLTSSRLTRRHAGWLAGVAAVAALPLLTVLALAGPSAEAQARPHTVAARAAVTGNTCPSMVFEPDASLYPAQPSFHAGYDNWIQKFDDSTAKWGFVISGQFPYALWMSWTVYTAKGVPTFTFPRTGTRPDPGSVNPFQTGVRMLAPSRSYHLYLMPATTPESVIETMKSQFGADNVATLPPFVPTGPNRNTAWGLVQRSYWSFAFDGTADWDRFGYGGPTDTPFPTMHAFHTDGAGGLTTIPVENCGAQSLVPKPTWHNPTTGKPIINAAKVPRPVSRIVNVPEFLIRNGFVVASSPPFAAPTPDPRYVQFFRPSYSQAPFADVSGIPAKGTPPDQCGGYVAANLPNNRVSLVHVPRLPSYPDYTGIDADTVRDNSKNVDFWSIIAYGVNRQIFTFYSDRQLRKLRNSELANQEVVTNMDGSATFVIYPRSANPAQIARIAAIAKANGWNLLRAGVKTRAIPQNMLAIREKGQNQSWANALSANDVTQGAPCYFSNPGVDPVTFPFNDVPANFQVTQTNGMGLTAPNGQNCTTRSFLTGRCLKALVTQYKKFGWKWNEANKFPSRQSQAGAGDRGAGDRGAGDRGAGGTVGA